MKVPPLEGATHMTQSQPGLHTRNTKETENKESLELSLKTQIGLVIQVFGPRRSLKGPGGADLVSTAPDWPGLDSWSPHTLTWYRAPFGPKGALKGLVLAPKGPFGDLGGPRRAPVGQILSQLPSNGLMELNLWSPHTLT